MNLPTALEELYLDHCDLISSEDLQFLPQSMQMLSLAFCRNIDNYCIDILAKLPYLHTINLQGCYGVTEIGINELIHKKFEGSIIIKSGYIDAYKSKKRHFSKMDDDDIELHPSYAILKKLINYKSRLINKFARASYKP